MIVIVSLAAPVSSPHSVRLGLPSPVLNVDPSASYGGLGVVNGTDRVHYAFTANKSLRTTGAVATAYQLSSPADGEAITSSIASALGLSGPVIYLGPNNYQAGPASGPDVTVGTVNGVLQWLYPTWTNDPTMGSSVPVDPGAPLPTDAQAVTDARQLLDAIGEDGTQFGSPDVRRHSAAVDVEFPMTVAGLVTDQYSHIAYGAGATVLTATGVIVNATAVASYPTLSPQAAVSILRSTGWTSWPGDIFGPVEPVSVDITAATLQLTTFRLSDGSSWLLPTWAFSGVEADFAMGQSSTYQGVALAIPARFLHVNKGH
jgi:hypothetical protein